MLTDLDIERIADVLLPRFVAAIGPAKLAHEPLLTKAELAAHLKVTSVTIDRMVRAGMPVERVTDDAPRFVRSAAETWYRSRPSRPKTLAKTSGVTLDGVRPIQRRKA